MDCSKVQYGVFCFGRRFQFETEIASMRWKVSWEDVILTMDRNVAGSVSRLSLAITEVSNVSVMTSFKFI